MTQPIEPQHIEDVCRIGQGSECCRYLVMRERFVCAKDDLSLRGTIDARFAAGKMNAQGDNCSGPPLFASTEGAI